MSTYIGPKASDIPVGTIGTQTVTANSIVVGSNVALTTTQLSVGNSSVNTVANSTAFYSSGNAISPYGMRNRIINGDMRIWQRGTSFSNPNSLSTAYSADRWAFYRSGYTANVTASQITGLTINGNNRNALRVQRTSGDTNTALVQCSQQIESINIRDLAGQTVTFSAYVRVGANFSGGTLSMLIYTGTGSDESFFAAGFTGAAVAGSTAIPSSATSYTKFTVTATLASNINEAAVQFYYGPSGTAGANDWFEIIDVQLEAGSVATPFERRPYGMELQLCQRYYETITAVNAGRLNLGLVTASNTTYAYGVFTWSTPKRSSNPLVTMSSYTTWRTIGINMGGSCTIDVNNFAPCAISSAFGVIATGYTAGQSNMVQNTDGNYPTVYISAEL